MSVCLYVCLGSTCAPGALRSQKRALDSLTLELQMVMSHHVRVENLGL